VAVAGVALVIAAAWWGLRARGPQPPRLADLGAMDPEVRALISDRIERVSDARSSASAWGALGIACEANGFARTAAQAYETATTLEPANARWWYRLALLRSRLGDPSGALSALDRVLALDANYAPAHWRRGLWLFDQGNTQLAEASFRRAAEVDRTDPGGFVGLARVFLARGENQAAVDTLERLLSEYPGDRYALQLLGTAYRRLARHDDAQFALAVGAGGEPLWRDPWSDEVAAARRGFAAVLKQATGHAMAGRFSEAIPLLEQLRAQKPEDVGLVIHLGGVYAAAGRLPEAIALLDAVVARHPDSFDAHLNLATAHVFARALDRAAAHADRAIALRRDSAKAHETRGMILWQSGQVIEATAALEKALDLDPRNQQPRVWIGLMLLERGQPARAIPFFEAALRSDPMLGDALVGIGRAQIDMGEIEQARLTLARAAQVDPESQRLKAAVDLLRNVDEPQRRGRKDLRR
jgi:tetratricopeptide (TPR) repeat protein